MKHKSCWWVLKYRCTFVIEVSKFSLYFFKYCCWHNTKLVDILHCGDFQVGDDQKFNSQFVLELGETSTYQLPNLCLQEKVATS